MCRKMCYDKKTANTILNERRKKGKKWAKECRVYFCESCCSHHLTSMEEYAPIEEIDLIFKDEWEKLKKG